MAVSVAVVVVGAVVLRRRGDGGDCAGGTGTRSVERVRLFVVLDFGIFPPYSLNLTVEVRNVDRDLAQPLTLLPLYTSLVHWLTFLTPCL